LCRDDIEHQKPSVLRANGHRVYWLAGEESLASVVHLVVFEVLYRVANTLQINQHDLSTINSLIQLVSVEFLCIGYIFTVQ
jgi:hypothetical protein